MSTVRFTDNLERHVACPTSEVSGARLLLGISCGGAWVTRDGGKSWNVGGKGMRAEYMPPELQFEPNAQDPHIVVQCPANPDVLRVQHHNGIFKSRDRAGSWTEIEIRGPARSVSPWPCIRGIPRPRGSFPRSRTRSAIRPTGASS